MKLRRVGGNRKGARSQWPLRKNCKRCGALKPITALYADLDAPVFTAYYCSGCAAALTVEAGGLRARCDYCSTGHCILCGGEPCGCKHEEVPDAGTRS